ncbi:hypothetical protein pCXcHC2016_29 [Xenohaliotis phage pCXc-HC2016]|nr:hypothetical protein pCXcHC2016_29 [Xenohaliotis phage pCXc-HC2016]AQW89136.1 hypothetical protein pCXcHR2015_29 [Xenohaliotis phage pCXc-HR2015]
MNDLKNISSIFRGTTSLLVTLFKNGADIKPVSKKFTKRLLEGVDGGHVKIHDVYSNGDIYDKNIRDDCNNVVVFKATYLEHNKEDLLIIV